MRDMFVVILASNINETIPNRLWAPLRDKEGSLLFLIRRLKKKNFEKIVLATSDKEEDRSIVELAEKNDLSYIRGDFSDVPDRLLKAAKQLDADHFVRVFANSPLLDIEMMEELYTAHIEGQYDYSCNEHREGVPWGLGCDVFKTSFLQTLCESNLTADQKGTIGQFIRQRKNKYKVLEWKYEGRRPSYKLNLETEKDYEVLCEIINHVDEYNARSVIDYLDKNPLVARHNIEEPPSEIGTEKMLFHPGKVENVLSRKLPDMLYPISVELTLTNSCNLKCIYCSDLDLRNRQGMKEQLDYDTLKGLLQDLSVGGTKGIVLEGGGEPTLYTHFSDVVHYAKTLGLAVGLITNGTTEMDPDLLKEFEWIRVSLDASTSEEYISLKGVDKFEKVIGNIARYATHCSTVGVGYVVTNRNISQIESLVMRLRELGASYFQCRPVVDSPELSPDGIDLSYLKYYQTAKFGVVVEGMKENAEKGNKGLPCYAHSITTIISGDGSVYICGRLNIYDWLKPIGNIRTQSFRRIWYGEERQNQAEMLSDGMFCKKNCPQCRITKFNEMFSRLEKVKSIHFI